MDTCIDVIVVADGIFVDGVLRALPVVDFAIVVESKGAFVVDCIRSTLGEVAGSAAGINAGIGFVHITVTVNCTISAHET